MTADSDEDLDRLKVKALSMHAFDRVLNDESDPLHAAAKEYNRKISGRLSRAYTDALSWNHPEVFSNLKQATEAALESVYSPDLSYVNDLLLAGVQDPVVPSVAPFPADVVQVTNDREATLDELVALRHAQEEATSKVLNELADQRDEADRRAEASDSRADEAERRAKVASVVAYISIAITVIAAVVGVAVSL